MPRYRYKCGTCGNTQLIFHLINETVIACKFCEKPTQMKKLLTTPNIIVDATHDPEREVGDLTNEYIDANRDILEQQKQEAKREEYEPS